MEIGSDQTAVKPERSPDLVSPAGHAFWWSEMVFMHVLSGMIFHIKVDQNDGSLFYMDHDTKKKLPPSAKDKYDDWWYEAFESQVLGDE